MCFTVMASNPKRPRLFSLDETVFMCTNDDEPPRLDDFKNVLEIVILSSILLFVLARQPSRNVFVWLSQRSVGWFITSISELTSVDQ